MTMRCRRALWVYSQPFILFRDLFRRVQTCSVEFCCFLSDQLLVKQSVCCGLDRTRVGQGMKNNSQAMLVLVVAARTGGTNNLYYWTESRQKKQTPSVLLLVGLRPAAASWRWPAWRRRRCWSWHSL